MIYCFSCERQRHQLVEAAAFKGCPTQVIRYPQRVNAGNQFFKLGEIILVERVGPTKIEADTVNGKWVALGKLIQNSQTRPALDEEIVGQHLKPGGNRRFFQNPLRVFETETETDAFRASGYRGPIRTSHYALSQTKKNYFY